MKNGTNRFGWLGFMGTTHYRIYQDLPGAKVVAVPTSIRPNAPAISAVVREYRSSDNTVPFDFSELQRMILRWRCSRTPKLDMVTFVRRRRFTARSFSPRWQGAACIFGEAVVPDLEEMARIRAAVEKSRNFFNVGMCIRAGANTRRPRPFRAGEFGQLVQRGFPAFFADGGWQRVAKIGLSATTGQGAHCLTCTCTTATRCDTFSAVRKRCRVSA